MSDVDSFQIKVFLKKADIDVHFFWEKWDRTKASDWTDLIKKNPEDQKKLDGIRRAFIKKAIDIATATCQPFCRLSDVGSKGPSSDIDITVMNTQSSLKVRLVHQLFREIFIKGDETRKTLTMSKVLDINIYRNAYYDICSQSGIPSLVEDCPNGLQLDDSARIDQACWSMWRLPLEPPTDWWSTTDGVQSLREGLATMHDQMNSCDQKNGVSNAVTNAEHFLGEILAEIKQLPNAGTSNHEEKLKNLRRQYVNAISTVRVLEEGAYISYGAFAHIVLSTQAGNVVKLDKLDYVASFFDNLGFFIEQQGNAIIKAIKYFDRCMKALDGMKYTVRPTITPKTPPPILAILEQSCAF